MATDAITYSKVSQDIASEKLLYTARFIGFSTVDQTRLNVHSALTANNDAQDIYRFRVTRTGTGSSDGVGFAYTADAALHIQLVDRKGRVLADNEGSAALKQAFEDFRSSDSKLKNGDYYLKVARGKDVTDDKQVVEYFLQVQNGKFTKDYDTSEKPPVKPAASTAAATLAKQSGATVLNQFRSSLLTTDNIFSQYQDIANSVGATNNLFDALKSMTSSKIDFNV